MKATVLPMESKPSSISPELLSLLQTAARQSGTDVSQLTQADSPQSLLQKLPPEDAARLRQVLNDRRATAQILASPQAQALLRKLSERK